MKPDEVAYTFTLGWRGMRKLIAAADRAGCEPDRAIVKALGLFAMAVEAVEKGGRVVIHDADGDETEVTGLIEEARP